MTVKMIVDHLIIVLASVGITVLVGLPLGVLAYANRSLRKVILWLVDILQTIPALALLGMIMIVLGSGKPTVVAGLVLYSLLPVVHNTCLGLDSVSPGIKEAARGMGMTPLYCLVHVEIPIAFPTIFTGIRIATVTAVGVAVFATFVGGGGLGSILYRGIHIQNMRLILSGTLTLMAMAVVFDVAMGWVEKRLVKGAPVAQKS